MNKPDELLSQLKTFHSTLQNSLPLEFDSPLYVSILQQNPAADPILQLSQRIDFAESESVNLLTGFRGNGKSTELRRLKHLLENQGHVVILTCRIARTEPSVAATAWRNPAEPARFIGLFE